MKKNNEGMKVVQSKEVSVVLSSYNAKHRLHYALLSLDNQHYPSELYEVVVVDDGSTDGTNELITNLNLSYQLIYVRLPKQSGRSAARNRGVESATGEIIIFSDSDMIVEPDFISKHAAHHSDNHDSFVCGSFWNYVYTYYYPSNKDFMLGIRKHLKSHDQLTTKIQRMMKNHLNHSPIALIDEKDITSKHIRSLSGKQEWAIWYEQFISKYGFYLEDYAFPWMFFVVMNVSVPKRALEHAGLFDEGFVGYGGEDEEMGYRLWKNGIRAKIDPTIKNFHQEHPRSTKQENDRFENKIYIVDKHSDIETVMYYFIDFVDEFTISTVYNSLFNALNEGILSRDFINETRTLLLHYFHQKFGRSSHIIFTPTFLKRVDNLQTFEKYQILSDFLNKLMKHIKGG